METIVLFNHNPFKASRVISSPTPERRFISNLEGHFSYNVLTSGGHVWNYMDNLPAAAMEEKSHTVGGDDSSMLYVCSCCHRSANDPCLCLWHHHQQGHRFFDWQTRGFTWIIICSHLNNNQLFEPQQQIHEQYYSCRVLTVAEHPDVYSFLYLNVLAAI